MGKSTDTKAKKQITKPDPHCRTNLRGGKTTEAVGESQQLPHREVQ